ncbi:Cytochrome P450 94B3 [Nymphaea thermarum]|nr:Cytochrome P450 94B3 [Nymphaea thermarum]
MDGGSGMAATLLIVLALTLLLCSLLIGAKKKGRATYQPPSYPVLGCLISFYSNRYRLLDWYTDLLSRSPTRTIVIDRLGSVPVIVTANPANVEYVLKTWFDNYPKGKPFTDILGDLLGRGIFNSDGNLWYRQRKAASLEFTTRSLRDYALRTVKDEASQRLLPLLQSACAEKRSIDLQEILNRFTFDTVCKVSFGMDPGCLLPSMPTCLLAREFDVAAGICAMRAASPLPWTWKVKRALQIGSEKRLREAIHVVHSSVMEIIRKKKEAGGGDDLLSRFVSMTGGDKDEALVRDMVISFLMAGKDTTSAALTWFFWLVAHHPEVQEDVVKEVRAKANAGLDFEALKELKFLKACLCESMRLYPPVAWDSKHAESDDILPDGTFVRKGSRVTFFPYGMGRMEDLWGKDCLEFRPQRWLKTTPDGKVEEEPVSVYKFPVFQAGPRQCLGKDMAFMEMRYVVAFVLTRFVLKPVESHQPRFVPFLTSRMAGGFPVLFEERQAAALIS